MTTKFDRVLEDYDDLVDDLLSANYKTFGTRLTQYLTFIDGNAEISELLRAVLPPVSFQEWYDKAKATVRSMVGSGTLDWPPSRPENLAMRLGLLRHLSSGKEDIPNFCVKFMYSSNTFNIMVSDFSQQIVEPTVRDIRKLVERSRSEKNQPLRATQQVSLAVADHWYQRPIGAIGIGLFITIVGGVVVAKLSGWL